MTQLSNQWLINLSKDESLWERNLETIPSMIHFEYMQLKKLAAQGQVYGVLLQLKDTYETILKIPVIMTLVLIDSDPIYKDGSEYNDIMKTLLQAPLTMGKWDNLAGVIVSKKNRKLNLPDNLIKIIKKTRMLYETEITSKGTKVVQWRNETIGHGALKFEGDANYQEEVKSLLNLLKEYFDGEGKPSIKGLYDSIYFQCGENKLVGDCYDKNAEHDLILHIAGSSYTVSNYVNDCNLKWYLFESFYSEKDLVKYSSYIDGKNNTVRNKYFSDLFEKHVLQQGRNSTVVTGNYTRAEDKVFEYFNMPPDYVEQSKHVELLQEQMDTLEKGVITIFMERGTGKSAFANRMSNYYNSKSLIENSLSRCYHVSNAALRGVSDFISSVTKGFEHSYNPADDLWGSIEKRPSLTLESENPAEDMAEFLNFYHDKYRKDYTILVIDGIDEITEQSEFILNYIPSKEQMDEGVFVVLTTRFSDEETVQGKSKKYIEKATQLADGQLKIHRHDEINTELLKQYIEEYENKFGFDNSIDKNALIKKSDYRILYLRAYLAIKDQVALDSTNETKFIESYMNYLLSFYGINQKQKLKEIAVSIALFPSISIKKYQEYLNCQEITYEFVGLFNDLLPLFTAVDLDDEKVYEFADAAYADFVIEEYPDVVKDVINFFYESLKNNLRSYFKYGPLLRDFQLGIRIDETLLNERLIFFSEGILGVWHKSYKHNNVSGSFYSSLVLIDFLKEIFYDNWANFGYGLYIKNELLTSILETFYLVLTNTCDDSCSIWAKYLNKLFNDDNSVTTKTAEHWKLMNFKEKVISHHNFKKLIKYLMSSYRDVANFTDWYWLFVPKTCESEFPYDIIPIIENLGCTDSYVEYMLHYAYCYDRDTTRDIRFSLACRWAYELLKVNLSSTTEEKLLNYLLEETIKSNGTINGKPYETIAKECFNRIWEKNYNVTACNGDVALVFKRMQGRNEIVNNYLNKLNYATQALLKLQPLSEAEYNLVSTAINSYITPTNDYEKKLIGEDIKKLHNAFYKQLCYERDNGQIAFFCLKMKDVLENNFIKIANNVYSEEKLISELIEWTKVFEAIADKGNRYTYISLSRIVISIVKAMEDGGYENEALKILEKYVYKYDTFAFCASFFTSNDKLVSNIIFDKTGLVYCTDNAMYLLNMLYKRNDNHKAAKLLRTIEKSVLLLENNLELCYESWAKTDIQKYRFMALREELQIENEFNKAGNIDLSIHFEALEELVYNFSRNCDFQEVSFHVEMILEFFWQTGRWDEGETCCKELLKILGSIDCLGDKIVENSLRNEMERINVCHKFFMFLNGKNVTHVKDHIPLKSSYSSSVFYNSRPLYNVINWFSISNITAEEKREKYQSLIKITLHSY